MLILFTIFIVILIIIIIVLSILLSQKKSKEDLDFMDKPNPYFNETDFVNCANIIDYLYQVYDKSMNSTVSPEHVKSELESKFQIVDVELLFTSSNLLGKLNCYYTLAGIAGRFKNSDYGIVAFRGTKNINEWITIDAKSVITENLSRSGLYDVPGEDFKPSTLVGQGWYDYYNFQKNIYRLSNNCICEKTIRDSFCRECDNVSKFTNLTDCDKNTTPTKEMLLPPLSEQVIRYIREHPTINSFQVTGHSLGSAICILSAFHIAKVFSSQKILNIYSFAGPTVGNNIFIEQYNQILLDKTFRIANVFDIITLIPPNLDHVGKYKYTFAYYNKNYGIWDYHNLYTGYVDNFNLIRA